MLVTSSLQVRKDSLAAVISQNDDKGIRATILGGPSLDPVGQGQAKFNHYQVDESINGWTAHDPPSSDSTTLSILTDSPLQILFTTFLFLELASTIQSLLL